MSTETETQNISNNKIETSDLISLQEIWDKFPYLKEIRRTRFYFNEIHKWSGHKVICVNSADNSIAYFHCKTCNIIYCNNCGNEDTDRKNHIGCENIGRKTYDLEYVDQPCEYCETTEKVVHHQEIMNKQVLDLFVCPDCKKKRSL